LGRNLLSYTELSSFWKGMDGIQFPCTQERTKTPDINQYIIKFDTLQCSKFDPWVIPNKPCDTHSTLVFKLQTKKVSLARFRSSHLDLEVFHLWNIPIHHICTHSNTLDVTYLHTLSQVWAKIFIPKSYTNPKYLSHSESF
jgi:hypothetical protein